MRIAIIGPAHPLRGGGISTFNERLAQVLQEQGHEVTIYSFSLQYPGFLFPGKSQFTTEPAPEGLRIETIINSVSPFNWFKVGNRIRNARPDLVIVRYWLPFMGPSLGTILRLVRKNKHSRIICIADNIIPHEKRPGDALFTRYFMPPVDAFITMSRDVLRDLQSMTQKPARFTPHPLYDNYGAPVPKAAARQKLGLKPDARYLLFFGFIRKYKGLDILLEALQDERFAGSNIRLLIAGEFYDDRESYTALLDAVKDLTDLFTDFVPNDEVRYYFSAADLIVQPYRSATQSGITQVAYHFDKPMVVTNVGGLHEVVHDGKTGFVTLPNPKDIADAILRFFEPESIPHLQENLAAVKQEYSWEVFVQNLMALAFPQNR